MASVLWNLTDNLAKGHHKVKCNGFKSNLEYLTAKVRLLAFKCMKLWCLLKKFDEDLIKRFVSSYQLYGREINKSNAILQKGVYPYKCINNLEKINEKLLLTKKEFFSNLTIEIIPNADYGHAKKVWEDFKLYNLGRYHDLYVQINNLLPADIFESFRNKFLESSSQYPYWCGSHVWRNQKSRNNF